jgi:hypothetical protein
VRGFRLSFPRLGAGPLFPLLLVGPRSNWLRGGIRATVGPPRSRFRLAGGNDVTCPSNVCTAAADDGIGCLGVHRGGVVRDLTRRACTAGQPLDVAGKIDPLTA